MEYRDRKQIAIVLYISAGSFEDGFRLRFSILDHGTVIMERRDLTLPSAPHLPALYHQWQTTYAELGDDPNMPMAPIQAVQSQTTHHSSTDQCQQATQQLQSALQEWFNLPEFNFLDAAIEAKSVKSTVTADQSVPVIFDFDTGNRTTDEQLRKLPWHLWRLFRQTLPQAEVVLSTGRYQRVSALTLPVRVLVVLGSREGGLTLEKDRQAWQQLDGAQLTVVEQPSAGELDRVLRSQLWDILFFAGHSSSQSDAINRGYLQINDTEIIELEALDEALLSAAKKGLKLAIFNSCDGLGLASFLAKLAVPFSIVMREPVPDIIARDFLQIFLSKFSQGIPLYLAMREARSQLKWRQGDPRQRYPCATWLPVLCQNPTQPELFWPTPQSFASPKPGSAKSGKSKTFIPLALCGAAMLMAITAWWLRPKNTQPLQTVTISETALEDSYSLGEEFLLKGPHSGDVQAGAEAFSAGDYQIAATLWRNALSKDRNNPELIIYLNNAVARLSGKPLKTIAVSIPARDAAGQAKELLRGVGQWQAENNCGLPSFIQAIENPDASLGCQTGETALQVLIADHENRNDADKVLARFEQLANDSRVIGLIGRYNSSMTFFVEENMRAGTQLPVISTTSTAVRQDDQLASGYVFRTSPTDEITAQKWRDYLDNKLTGKDVPKIVVLFDSGPNSQYSQSLQSEFLKLLPATTRDQVYTCDLKDINPCLADLKGNTADAIVLMPSDDANYIRAALNFVQRYDNDFKGASPVLIGGDTLYDGNLVLQSIANGSLLEDLIVAVPWHRGTQPTAFEQGATDLWVDSINWRTVMGYDAAWLLTNAITASSECNSESMPSCRTAIQEHILSNGLDDGATGTMQFSRKGNREPVDGARVSVLVNVNLDQRTFECLEGESCY